MDIKQENRSCDSKVLTEKKNMTLLPTSVVLKKFLLWMDSPLHVPERSCCAAERWMHDDDDGDDDDDDDDDGAR